MQVSVLDIYIKSKYLIMSFIKKTHPVSMSRVVRSLHKHLKKDITPRTEKLLGFYLKNMDLLTSQCVHSTFTVTNWSALIF